MPTSILATSREIYAEANSVIQKLIRVFIFEHIPKIIDNSASTEDLCKLSEAVGTKYDAIAVRTTPSVDFFLFRLI